jgi:metal-responsive CopG/Arc/MetJ family transcriptional regulator
MRKRGWRRVKIIVTLPDGLVDELDDLAEDVDASRSDVIEDLLNYALEHIDEIYPIAEEEEEEEEE